MANADDVPKHNPNESFLEKLCSMIGQGHMVGQMVYLGYSTETPTGRQFSVTCRRCGLQTVASEKALRKLRSVYISRMVDEAIKRQDNKL